MHGEERKSKWVSTVLIENTCEDLGTACQALVPAVLLLLTAQEAWVEGSIPTLANGFIYSWTFQNLEEKEREGET